jgi:Domain of unknown function (DUF4159)
MQQKILSWTALSSLLLVFASVAQTGDPQRPGYRSGPRPHLPVDEEGLTDPVAPRKEFAFARLIYKGGWGPNNWATDAPKADHTLIAAIQRLTNLDVRELHFFIPLTSKEIFKYPFLYTLEVGYMQLSREEADILREYLLRGGFLVVDDFHGTYEWANFEEQIRKVFPDCAIEEIPRSHAIFHCFFDIEELFQIPGVQMLYSGRPYEKDGYVPHFRGIFDDTGRLMVMINFNSDLGDAWEWADSPYYPEKYSGAAYRLGINYIIYSMTH